MVRVDRLDPSFSVRVYGPSVGHGSFARVAAGMREGLAAHGKLAGFVPVDDSDMWRSGGDAPAYGGDLAPCAVYVGPPAGVALMSRWHEERWALLPANSSWMPENLLRSMWPHVTGFLAPSAWAEGVLRSYVTRLVTRLGEELGPRDVSVWQHGVGREFVAKPERAQMLRDDFAHGAFRVLHLASTRLGRKGTAQLVEAWCQLIDAGSLPRWAALRLVLDEPPNWPAHVTRMAERFMREGDPQASVRVISRQGASPDIARAMYQGHHLVCQPSRGEGFGLVPLEARASGVPVLMTGCTGHAEHAWDRPGEGAAARGVRIVLDGPEAPIDDGPGAMAPSVKVSEVRYALESAYLAWPRLAAEALEASPQVGEDWSWSAVTERWLKEKRA